MAKTNKARLVIDEEAGCADDSNNDEVSDDEDENWSWRTDCPDHLLNVLHIIRKWRRVRIDILQTTGLQDAMLVTPATEERRAAKENINNFTMINMSDLMED